MNKIKVETRKKKGIIEHKHAYYEWWHPVTRVHSSRMLEQNIGCFGDMWICVDRNIDALKKEMEHHLVKVKEAETIRDRAYWMGEVFKLTTWGIIPCFEVDEY